MSLSIWLPLSINSTSRTAKLSWYDAWSIDITSGAISIPDTTTYDAVADSNTVTTTGSVSALNVSGVKVVGPIGGSSNASLTFHNVHITSENDGTLQFNYTILSGKTVYANIDVGREPTQTISFLATKAGEVGVSVWQYLHRLSKGDVKLSGPSRGVNGSMIESLST